VIIDTSRPHKHRHEPPPRDPSDRAPQQMAASEQALPLGLFARVNLRDGSREYAATPAPVPTAAQYRRVQRNRARQLQAAARLALSPEAGARQVVRMISASRWRRQHRVLQSGNHSSTPPDAWRADWALDLARRLRRREQRHGDSRTARNAARLAERVLAAF